MKELILVAPTATEKKRFESWAPLFGYQRVHTLMQLEELSFSGKSQLAQTLFIHFPGSACLQSLKMCPEHENLSQARHLAVIPKPSSSLEMALMNYGFRGVLSATASRDLQAVVLEKVTKGELAFSNTAMSEYILSSCKPGKVTGYQLLDSVTPKEKQVIILVCEGMTNEEIAKSMNISINTVKMHLQNIYKKTNLKSRSQLLLTFGS
ncbi:LuxR C-terminal-related transcriptional regulator [Shewanella submarina]|uniref:Response regulator transcription factor n=1 Tax=Shewanella submarina TaxID=2016376 RepID=A0ABV7G6W0_9GAMM|nr:LuxR C-terminal-related transcriptional regulator [Shewanella submarina]MCL1037372.1 LuxR C-terminal-related transcriptional regulator [Shewanella submarina]